MSPIKNVLRNSAITLTTLVLAACNVLSPTPTSTLVVPKDYSEDINPILDEYTSEEVAEWLDLMSNDWDAVICTLWGSTLFDTTADFDLAQRYREANVEPMDVCHLLNVTYRIPLSFEEGMEYINNGIPRALIHNHKRDFSEYTIQEIKPYVEAFWDLFWDFYDRDMVTCAPAALPGCNNVFLSLVGYPIDKIQNCFDLGVDPYEMPRIIDNEGGCY